MLKIKQCVFYEVKKTERTIMLKIKQCVFYEVKKTEN